MSSAEALSSVAVTLAFVYLAIVSVVLSVIDVRQHRLPDRVVLTSYAVALMLFGVAAVLGAGPGRLLRAVVGMLLLFAFYFVMRVASRSSIGGGDVKLAGLLGLYLGWLGWSELLFGAAAAFVIGGLFALGLLLVRRADRRTRIPFGPAMLAGAWVMIAATFAVDVSRSLPAA